MTYDTLNPYDSHKAHAYEVECVGRKPLEGGKVIEAGVDLKVFANSRAEARHIAASHGYIVRSVNMVG